VKDIVNPDNLDLLLERIERRTFDLAIQFGFKFMTQRLNQSQLAFIIIAIARKDAFVIDPFSEKLRQVHQVPLFIQNELEKAVKAIPLDCPDNKDSLSFSLGIRRYDKFGNEIINVDKKGRTVEKNHLSVEIKQSQIKNSILNNINQNEAQSSHVNVPQMNHITLKRETYTIGSSTQDTRERDGSAPPEIKRVIIDADPNAVKLRHKLMTSEVIPVNKTSKSVPQIQRLNFGRSANVQWKQNIFSEQTARAQLKINRIQTTAPINQSQTKITGRGKAFYSSQTGKPSIVRQEVPQIASAGRHADDNLFTRLMQSKQPLQNRNDERAKIDLQRRGAQSHAGVMFRSNIAPASNYRF